MEGHRQEFPLGKGKRNDDKRNLCGGPARERYEWKIVSLEGKGCGLDKKKWTGKKGKVSKCFYPEDPIKFDKFKKGGRVRTGMCPHPHEAQKENEEG